MYIDSHCHLDFDVFTPSRKALIQTALAANITHFINPAVSFANWHKVIELSQAFPFIIPALGLHPVFCSEHTLDHLPELSKWVTANNIKFVGEIGLDKRYKDNYESQLLFFEAQIKIANKLKKPVIIHAVKSHHDIIGIIKKRTLNTVASFMHLMPMKPSLTLILTLDLNWVSEVFYTIQAQHLERSFTP